MQPLVAARREEPLPAILTLVAAPVCGNVVTHTGEWKGRFCE